MRQVPRGMTPEEIRQLVGTAPLMLEVGCHDGWPPRSHTRRFLEAMPDVRLHCFEPDPRPAADFRGHFDGDPRVTFYQTGVGDVDGTLQFYASTGEAGGLADWTMSGSFRPPTGHLTRSPEIRFKEPVPLPCTRLDTWLEQHPDVERVDFIWADVQGAQRALLAGGLETLRRTRYLYIECHETPQYDGEPSQAELIDLLPGFTPLAVFGGENLLFHNRSLDPEETADGL